MNPFNLDYVSENVLYSLQRYFTWQSKAYDQTAILFSPITDIAIFDFVADMKCAATLFTTSQLTPAEEEAIVRSGYRGRNGHVEKHPFPSQIGFMDEKYINFDLVIVPQLAAIRDNRNITTQHKEKCYLIQNEREAQEGGNIVDYLLDPKNGFIQKNPNVFFLYQTQDKWHLRNADKVMF